MESGIDVFAKVHISLLSIKSFEEFLFEELLSKEQNSQKSLTPPLIGWK